MTENLTVQKLIDGIQKLYERTKNDPEFASTLGNYPQPRLLNGITSVFQWQAYFGYNTERNCYDLDTRVPFKGTDEEFDFLLKCLMGRQEVENENALLKYELEKERYRHLDTINELARQNPTSVRENFLSSRLRTSVREGIMETLRKENATLSRELDEGFLKQLDTQMEQLQEQHKEEIRKMEIDHADTIKQFIFELDERQEVVDGLRTRIAEYTEQSFLNLKTQLEKMESEHKKKMTVMAEELKELKIAKEDFQKENDKAYVKIGKQELELEQIRNLLRIKEHILDCQMEKLRRTSLKSRSSDSSDSWSSDDGEDEQKDENVGEKVIQAQLSRIELE